MAMTDDPRWIYEIFRCHCLTIAEGLEKEELLRRLGCNEESFVVPEDDEEMLEMHLADGGNYDVAPIIIAGKSDRWTFAFEPISAYGSIPERLRLASHETRVFCSANVTEKALFCFEAWEDGELMVKCDVSGKSGRWGAFPDLYLPEMHRFGFFTEYGNYSAVNLALSMALTGIELPYPESCFPFPNVRKEGLLVGRIPALNLGPEAGASTS